MYVKLKRKLVLWHYNLYGANNKVIATSETFYSQANARRAAVKLANAIGAKFRDK